MSQPIETAYIDILPDFNNFERLLRAGLTNAMRSFERQAERSFGEVEDAARDAGRSISINITIGANTAERAIDDMADSAARDFDRVERSARSAGRTIATTFGAGVAANALTVFNQLANAVGTVFSGISSFGFIALILAAIPPVIALAAALADLAGLIALLPAGIAVLAAAIAPLVIGFMNFGEAIDAIQKGDPKKIEEALNKLAPAARNVAKEFAALLPQFKQLQLFVQEQLFSKLQGTLTELVAATLPSLQQGLGKVAGAFGTLFDSVAGIFALPQNVALINKVFDATARIIGNLGPAATKFITGFLAAVEAGLPVVENLFNRVSAAIGEFGDFLVEATGTGTFQNFIDEALATLGELFELGKSIGALFGTIFDATDESGRGFIQTLTDLVDRMNEFFKSAEGQDALQDLTELVIVVGQALGQLVDLFLLLVDIGSDLDEAFRSAKQGLTEFFIGVIQFKDQVVNFLFTEIPEGFKRAFQAAIDGALKAVGTGIGAILFLLNPENLVAGLREFGPKLLEVFGTALTAAKDFLVTKFEEIKAFIFGVPETISSGVGPAFQEAGRNLIQSFMNGFRAVGSFIGDVAGDIVGSVKGFINKAIDRINVGIADIDDFLPGNIGRIPRLAKGAYVSARPGGILANIGEGREDEVVAPLSKLDDMLNSGPSIVFGPGSIQINFATVPTEEQALMVGQAVGQGTIAVLERRSVRSQIRAI